MNESQLSSAQLGVCVPLCENNFQGSRWQYGGSGGERCDVGMLHGWPCTCWLVGWLRYNIMSVVIFLYQFGVR